MARAFHEALGVSFQSADPHNYPDALLYGLTLVWGTEVTSFNLTQDAATVSFAICDMVSKEPAKSGTRKYADSQAGMKSTPKKQPPSEKNHGMAVDEETRRRECHVGYDAGDGAEEEESTQPKMTHREPSYKNARWLRKRPGAPRWTQTLCRLLEDLMEADETEEETDVGAIVYEIWKTLLDYDKSGKDALKSKIKEHKKKQKHKEKKQC